MTKFIITNVTKCTISADRKTIKITAYYPNETTRAYIHYQ